MNNNLKDRLENNSNVISNIKKDDAEIEKIKTLGQGVEGTVILIKLNKYKIALKVINLKEDLKKITKDRLLKIDGMAEMYASHLINLLIENKISPHFVYNYKTFISKNTILNYNEFIDGQSLRKFLKKKHDKKLIFNIFFQILSALHSMKYQFNMIHADLHFENILIAKVPEGGFWKYKINGKEYYLPNMGYQIYLNDYGYAMIPGVLGKKWYSELFNKIKDSNKYNLYDLLLIRFEFLDQLKPYFYRFFEKYFDYNDTDEYRKKKIPYFPEDLDILDIIELLFSKNEISNCKTLEWYCYNDEKDIKGEKIIEEYDLDKKIDKKKIDNVLNSKF